MTSGSILNVGFIEVLRILCPHGELLHTVASRLSNNGILWRHSVALGYAEKLSFLFLVSQDSVRLDVSPGLAVHAVADTIDLLAREAGYLTSPSSVSITLKQGK